MTDPEKPAPARDPERIFPLTRFKGDRPAAPGWFDDAVAAPHEDGAVEVDGASIRWRRWAAEDADTPGLVFVHGGLAHLGWWDFIAPFFTKRFRPAALSLSGMGGSGWRERYTMPAYADEVLAVAETAGLFEGPKPPLIVGHSFGGFVALATAALHGGRFAGAVVADSPIRFEERNDPRPEPRRRGARVYPDEAAALARFSLLPNQDCPNLFIIDHIARTALRRATDEEGREGFSWAHDPDLWVKREVTRAQPVDALVKAKCPLAFVRGARSALVTDERWADLAAEVDAATPRISIPDAEHHLMLDQPLAFVAAVRALLSAWPR